MELSKLKSFLKDDNYVHCSICRNYRNINSFAHRKSKEHQKKLAIKLRKVVFDLSLKKKKAVVIHDVCYDRDHKRFCHFCGVRYAEHHLDQDDLIVENLGSMYHYANSHHADSVKEFLKRNFSDNKVEKYCIQKKELDCFLEKVSEAKEKHLKEMDIVNNLILEHIKKSEEERKKLIQGTLVESFNINQSQDPKSNIIMAEKNDSLDEKSKHLFLEHIKKSEEQRKKLIQGTLPSDSRKNDNIRVPPWLEDVTGDSSVFQTSSSAPVIGPTLDTLLKHEAYLRKKRLLKNRVGANFDRKSQSSSKWLPSFQGVWNQGRRKQLQIQFKRKNPKFNF